MLSYQHGYHAGNFADVVKHLTLCRIVNYMVQKDKPLFYLDTHSGCGIYDLNDKKAVKTAEYHTGIGLLWEKRQTLSELFNSYIKTIESLNDQNRLRYYPGSAYFALANLRLSDRLIFTELHPQEYNHLKQLTHYRKRIYIDNADGILTLKSSLPPPERRGLIFIDPSFEVKTDYQNIAKALENAYLRFATGVYCLWYPILSNQLHKRLIQSIKASQIKNSIRIEFFLEKENNATGMFGCGLLVINPPFCLQQEMSIILDELISIINPGQSYYIID